MPKPPGCPPMPTVAVAVPKSAGVIFVVSGLPVGSQIVPAECLFANAIGYLLSPCNSIQLFVVARRKRHLPRQKDLSCNFCISLCRLEAREAKLILGVVRDVHV